MVMIWMVTVGGVVTVARWFRDDDVGEGVEGGAMMVVVEMMTVVLLAIRWLMMVVRGWRGRRRLVLWRDGDDVDRLKEWWRCGEWWLKLEVDRRSPETRLNLAGYGKEAPEILWGGR
ncbi:hypothetical protein Tco_1289182, partial [Tanacetum coccineum]